MGRVAGEQSRPFFDIDAVESRFTFTFGAVIFLSALAFVAYGQ
jgi:hypothetical protein